MPDDVKIDFGVVVAGHGGISGVLKPNNEKPRETGLITREIMGAPPTRRQRRAYIPARRDKPRERGWNAELSPKTVCTPASKPVSGPGTYPTAD